MPLFQKEEKRAVDAFDSNLHVVEVAAHTGGHSSGKQPKMIR